MNKRIVSVLTIIFIFFFTGCSNESQDSKEKDITAFSFEELSPVCNGLIRGNEIKVSVPEGTDLSTLTASFSTNASSVSVGTTTQVSGVTVNDFSSPLEYRASAEDGTMQIYTVTVTETTGKSGRLLGFDILNTTQNGSFDDNVTAAKTMGLEFITLHLHWNSIETAPGVFTDPGGALSGLSTAAAAYGLKLALIISPIDLPGRATPADLNSTGFDEEAMRTRFEACLDYILNNWVDKSLLTSISVGNEIDAYDWTGNGDSPTDYAAFLYNIEAHLDTHGIDTAFTGTHSGLISGDLRDLGTWTAMAGNVDAIHVTYYPMTSSFQVEEPDVVENDLQALVDEFAGIKGADQSPGSSIPLYLQEVGYQTSPVCGSSNGKQAEFFYNFFQAWDKHADRIPQASILRLCDVSRSSAEQTATDYGIPGNQGFIEYIRTLGLRTFPGTGADKPAAAVIREETEKRGW